MEGSRLYSTSTRTLRYTVEYVVDLRYKKDLGRKPTTPRNGMLGCGAFYPPTLLDFNP